MIKSTEEDQTKKNIMDRDFDRGMPYKVLLTDDITYLPYGKGQIAYLSAIKEGTTGEFGAHHFSISKIKENHPVAYRDYLLWTA